jgi:hypothetical protein
VERSTEQRTQENANESSEETEEKIEVERIKRMKIEGIIQEVTDCGREQNNVGCTREKNIGHKVQGMI